MEYSVSMDLFGPVPSRRLGRSIGVNNIPPKVCSFACVYCQLGRPDRVTAGRESFGTLDEFRVTAQKFIDRVLDRGEQVDYLSFVPDGEPTLDRELGQKITFLKKWGIPLALITNGSHLHDAAVRGELCRLDWVSIKVDAPNEKAWRKINRPHKALDFSNHQEGLRRFAQEFPGFLATETMMVEGYNDSDQCIEALAQRVRVLSPNKAYISIPTRPPAVKGLLPASEESLARAYDLYQEQGVTAELLTGYEGDRFAASGNSADDLLSITAVHPMTRSAVETVLNANKDPWELAEEMVTRGELIRTVYRDREFYMRALPSRFLSGHKG